MFRGQHLVLGQEQSGNIRAKWCNACGKKGEGKWKKGGQSEKHFKQHVLDKGI